MLYEKFIYNESNVKKKYFGRWNEQGYLLHEDMFNLYQRAFTNRLSYVTSTKMRDFQYRTLLGKLVLNTDLFHWGKLDTLNCTLCKGEPETYEHLFIKCSKVTPIIKELTCKLIEITNMCEINWSNILIHNFNVPSNNVIHEILIYYKQFVYSRRCTNSAITIKLWKDHLSTVYQFLVFDAKPVCKEHKIIARWSKMFDLF